MSRRLLALALLLLPLTAIAESLPDNLRAEREQAQREDNLQQEANRRNDPGSTPRVPQWYLDELRERNSGVNTHYEAYKREYAIRMREQYEAHEAREKADTASKAAARAEKYVALSWEIATARDEDLQNPWYFTALLDRAWPDPYTMRMVADAAIKWHPQAWRLRHGMLVASTCDTPPPEMSHYSYDYAYARHCIATRHRAGFDELRVLLQSPSVLERALYCTALHASLASIVDSRKFHDMRGVQTVTDVDEQRLLGDIAACEATLPAGHAFDEGLFRPAQAYGAFRGCDFATSSWQVLFNPRSWQDVDLTDAAAMRANIARLYDLQRPAMQCYEDKPSFQTPAYGWNPLRYDWVPERADVVNQHMDVAQARKVLGRPKGPPVALQRRDVPGSVREACMHWRDRDGVSAQTWKKTLRRGINWTQTTTVYFDRNGKACASDANQLSSVEGSSPNYVLPIPACEGCVAKP